MLLEYDNDYKRPEVLRDLKNKRLKLKEKDINPSKGNHSQCVLATYLIILFRVWEDNSVSCFWERGHAGTAQKTQLQQIL